MTHSAPLCVVFIFIFLCLTFNALVGCLLGVIPMLKNKTSVSHMLLWLHLVLDLDWSVLLWIHDSRNIENKTQNLTHSTKP